MSGFLEALGEKLADRWLALLVLPGALYCATAVVAVTLRQRHAVDVGLLGRRVSKWVAEPIASSTAGQIELAVVALAAAAAAGLAAHSLGRLIEAAGLAADWADWPQPFRAAARRQAARRLRRWDVLDASYKARRLEAAAARAAGRQVDAEERQAAFRRRSRTAELTPRRPTWSGDRIEAVESRLRSELSVDLAREWPVVWLSAADAVRTEIGAARDAMSRAAVLGGWAVLYAVLTYWWSPALAIALCTALAARFNFRSAVDVYAQLVEAAVRISRAPAPDGKSEHA